MSQALCLIDPSPPVPPRGEDLPSEDGIPMESNFHRTLMNLLIEVISVLWADRDDFFAGGNFRGPDFFVVLGVPRRQRDKWVVWEEDGRAPNVVIELTSESTAAEDHGAKKRVYEQLLRVPEYFIYDPRTRALEGYRLQAGAYQPIAPGPDGRCRSEQLGLWLGTWEGRFQGYQDLWLRFFKEDGTLCPTEAELRQQAEERLRAYEERFGKLT